MILSLCSNPPVRKHSACRSSLRAASQLRRFRAAGRYHFLALLLALLLLLLPSPAGTVFGETLWPEPDGDVQAEGALLMDADSGTVLYQKNEHEHYFPASITKVLTAVIVLEKTENLDEMVEFSADATGKNLEPNSTVIAASAGDQLSVRDCLYCLLLHSANDCANALAEHVAGSNEAFAELMNQKAAELGCTDSHFRNPSGLNDPEHYTSAHDMALILQYAIRNPVFRQIDAVQAYTHAPISRYPDPASPENTVYAHHRMMRKSYRDYYEGVFAGKTGYTTLAGNTLLTAAERDGMTLIAVILNGHNTQYSDTRRLFDFGFEHFHSLSAAEQDQSYTALSDNFRIQGISMVDMLQFRMDSAQRVTLPKGQELRDAQSILSYSLSEAERKNQTIARVDYSFAGRAVGKAYIRLVDERAVREQQARDAEILSQKVLETVPERISVQETPLPTVAGQLTPESSENRAPIILDRESGSIRIQKPILRLLQILALLAAAVLLIMGILYLMQRREEFLRKRRRRRMLKHTRDLTRAQKARRDLMLGKKKSGRARKR